MRTKTYLNRLRSHDEDSYNHSLRVGSLCTKLGYINNFHKETIKLLDYSGKLHDIGKLLIPKQILLKESALDIEERIKVKTHSRLGYLLLRKIENPLIRRIMVSSHEFQKNPYPRTGEDRRKTNEDRREIKRSIERRNIKDRRSNNYIIKTLGQILAVSDIYDALKNPRSYKDALSKKEIIRQLPKQFTGNQKYIDQILKK